MAKYQDIYPTPPKISSDDIQRVPLSDFFILEYFEAEPAEIPPKIFEQHHILINLKETPLRVENWRDGEYRDFIFSPFEIIITPAGIESAWKWHEKAKVIAITLEPQKFENFALKELGVLLSPRNLKNIPQMKDEETTNAALFIYEAIKSKPLGHLALYESFARIFLVKLIQKYGEKNIQTYNEEKGFSPEKCKSVINYIKDHFSKSITIEDLAKAAGLSPYHFSRIFKKSLGKTPMQFVQEYRIDEAKILLKDPNLPLIDIANRCGFSDQSHFTKAFKRIEKISPKDFRNSL